MSAPKSIFVDVDGTLLSHTGKINVGLIAILEERKKAGFEIILWSMRGSAHALDAAQYAGCTHLFSAIIPKPGLIVDDKGLMWLQDVRPMVLDEWDKANTI